MTSIGIGLGLGFTARTVAPSLPAYIRFTTAGSSFAPWVESGTASVTWTVEETSATSTSETPAFNFGSAATRHVRLACSDWSQLSMLNLGFSNADDQGRYQMGAGRNWAATPVTAIENLLVASGLVYFAAANGDLSGALDFSGLSNLQFIECFGSDVESVNLAGCTSLIRLCMEANRLTSLNLNPVAANIRDVRAAVQQGGALEFAALTVPLAQCYHFCVRDQVVTGHPTTAQLPVVEELWNWNTGRTGALIVSSTAVSSILSFQNGWTSANLANQFPAGRNGAIDLRQCQLASINVTGCDGLLTMDLRQNPLGSVAVDALVNTVNSWGTSGGTLNLQGCGGPSSDSSPARTALIGRSWSLTTDAEVDNPSGVLFDSFNRADGAVGNGWVGVNSPVASIVSNQLTRSDSGAYRMLVNPARGELPADYTVSMVIDHASSLAGGFLWVVGRWLNGQGVRFGFEASRTYVTCGNANDWQAGNVTITVTNGIPASWDVNQSHTLAIQFQGTTARFFIDGVEYGYATITVNAAATGTGYGVAGEGLNRQWDSIGTSV